MARDENFCVLKWLTIDDEQLRRYSKKDRTYVKDLLTHFDKLAREFFRTIEKQRVCKTTSTKEPSIFS